MAKIQKVWLVVCGAMFLIPEILWGLVQRTMNQLTSDLFSFEFIKKIYLLNELPNINIIRIFLLCQFLSILGLLIISVKNKKMIFAFLFLFFLPIIMFAFVVSFLFTFASIG